MLFRWRTIKNLAFGIAGTLPLLALVIWGVGGVDNILFQSGTDGGDHFGIGRRNRLRIFREQRFGKGPAGRSLQSLDFRSFIYHRDRVRMAATAS